MKCSGKKKTGEGEIKKGGRREKIIIQNDRMEKEEGKIERTK